MNIRNILEKRWAIPLLIFAVGLGITLHYALSTNYLAYCDSVNAVKIYDVYRESWEWYPIGNLVLQSSSLTTIYFPALIQHITQFPPELLLKLYIAIISAFIPVIIYLISKKFVSAKYAFMASVFSMGWVTFLQAGSFDRSNIATLLYGLLILLLLYWNWSWKIKIPIIIAVSVLLVLSHYVTVLITIFMFGFLLLAAVIRKRKSVVLPTAVCLCVLCIGFGLWYGIANKDVVDAIITHSPPIVVSSQPNSNLGISNNVVTNSGGTQSSSGIYEALSLRDKITQALFGIQSPDGDTQYQANLFLLVAAWLTIMITLYGIWHICRNKQWQLEEYAILFAGLLIIIVTVAVPTVSRIYGIERVYALNLMMLAPCYVIGGKKLSEKIHINPVLVLSILTLLYGILMYKYGVIHSLIGI